MLTRKDEGALSGIDDRINSMERRLRNARAARDSYVDYLRGKYPSWNPSLSSFKFEHNAQEPLVNRLATSDLQWDLGSERDKGKRRPIVYNNSQMTRSMPTSGPLLESDIRNTKKRLMEIASQLKTLRGSRMSMSTDQFMRMAQFMEKERDPISLLSVERENVDRLDTVRQRLSEIVMVEASPVRTPTEEEKEDIRMEEERDKMMADIRAGLIPNNWNTSSYTIPQIPPIRQQEDSFQPIPQNVPGRNEVQPPKEEHNVRFAEPPSSDTKLDAKNDERRSQTIVQPVEAPPQKPTTEPPPAKNEEPAKPAESAYSRMMSLLDQKNDDSSEDSDFPASKTGFAAKPATQQASKVPTSGMGLLSQYLGKADNDSSEEDQLVSSYKPQPAKKAPAQSLSQTFMNADDSDDDFFN